MTQVLGILVALAGLAGYWLTRDVQRTVLSEVDGLLVNPQGDAFQASFVLAGRDYDYDPAGPLVWRNGEQVRAYTTKARLGQHTDTIVYVNIVGNKVYMVSIPRDTYLPQHRGEVGEVDQAKVNAVYTSGKFFYSGDNRADYVRQAVSELLDVPIDYYAVISIDIFKELVDAVGGVEVNVPTRMEHTDQAAGLHIDLQPGLQHLDGEQAANFVRFRDSFRGDIDRIDNVKTLALALLERLRALNVRAAPRLPKLLATYLEKVETNLSPALVARLVPRLSSLEIQAATLPTHEVEVAEKWEGKIQTKGVLSYHPEEVETFLAGLFGGEAREITGVPEAEVLITNRSGVTGLGEEVRRQFTQMGIPAGRLRVRQGEPDSVTRVVVTNDSLGAARYYAELLGVGWQQVDRFDSTVGADLELILGRDAETFYGTRRLAQGGKDDSN